ncbi:Hypothetical predicted protein [Cloeon dipterum]|uniref:Uncharacterized protein n=1 Tax=Cloeon dipterum TaxID=197152 RepID=A0A8S1CC88_9INSE|nr:Hypothetical predicted protein [Cloeon dipterum]
MITCSVLLCSCECRLRGQRPPGVDRWPRLHFGILTRLAEPRDEGDFQCPHHRQRQASAGRRPRHRTETIEDEVTSDNWIDELCLKDNLLADQRKIIVEIQIKLDEKQKEMEELRQSLDTQHSVVDWLEAEKQQRLLEADEKLEKSVKAVQTLVSRNLELAARAEQIGSTTRRSTCGANWTKPGARWSS